MREHSVFLRRALSILSILGLIITTTTMSPPFIFAQETAPSSQETANQKTDTDELAPLPLSPIEKAEKEGTALRLSLKEVTKMALQNNLDIAIQDTNEEYNQLNIRQQFGNYDPQLTASLQYTSQKSAPYTTYNFSSDYKNQNTTANWDFTFTQPVKTGGTLTAQWNSGRSESNTTSTIFNPRYSSSASVKFTQPLLRNFRIDSIRGNIKIANLDIKTSDSKFKQTVTDTISNIQKSYWDLVLQIENFYIQRNSVELARTNYRNNKRRVEVGTLAPIDVTDAEATMAQREVNLLSAEESIVRAENSLRSLISNDRKAEIWQKMIVPTDVPDFQEYKIDAETAIETAMKYRPELEQSDFDLQKLSVNRKLLENNRRWKFDLNATFGGSGLAGPQSYRMSDTGELLPQTPPALVGGIGNAYETIFTQGYTNWTISFDVTIPLRNRSLDAQIAQNRIDKERKVMTLRQTEQNIQVEVRNALQKLETSHKKVQQTALARQLAKERYDGENKRFEAGLSENYRVLETQNTLAQSEYDELSAKIGYKTAVIDLQKAIYTLIESSDFEVAKGSSGKIAAE